MSLTRLKHLLSHSIFDFCGFENSSSSVSTSEFSPTGTEEMVSTSQTEELQILASAFELADSSSVDDGLIASQYLLFRESLCPINGPQYEKILS